MARQICFRLSEEATEKYFEIQQTFIEAQVDEDSIPQGLDLRIEFGAPLPDNYAYLGSHFLGEVVTEITE